MENELVELRKKRYQFHIMRELQQIEELDAELPGDKVRKYISSGGFSSIGFIKFVAERTHIKRLTVSTLRVGKKHLAVLDTLYQQKKIEEITFIVGKVMKNDKQMEATYGYYKELLNVCKRNGWKVICYNNHSKILLFDTDAGKFVIETSSNLNENPNMEQFSFERSEELYSFYIEAFEQIIFKKGVVQNE